jgi:3-methyladenine DNA glycosylase AlkD
MTGTEDTPNAAEIVQRLTAAGWSVPSQRIVRRDLTRELKSLDGPAVLSLGVELTPLIPRWVTCELVANHRDAFELLDQAKVEQLGEGLASWYDVDGFGTILAGPAWRAGLIPDAAVVDWAHSPDRWWRRAALVATVPLNAAITGTGDPARTLAICRLLVADRDDMVVKALSWALRFLSQRDPKPVEAFMAEQGDALAPRIRREVAHKLRTGRKTPKR